MITYDTLILACESLILYSITKEPAPNPILNLNFQETFMLSR